MRALAPVAFLVQLALVAPAHAAAEVETSYAFAYRQFESGYVIAAKCEALVNPLSTTDVPIATKVLCTINGFASSSAWLGPVAEVVMSVVVVTNVVEICVTGEAQLLGVNPPSSYTVTSSRCQTHLLS